MSVRQRLSISKPTTVSSFRQSLLPDLFHLRVQHIRASFRPTAEAESGPGGLQAGRVQEKRGRTGEEEEEMVRRQPGEEQGVAGCQAHPHHSHREEYKVSEGIAIQLAIYTKLKANSI